MMISHGDTPSVDPKTAPATIRRKKSRITGFPQDGVLNRRRLLS